MSELPTVLRQNEVAKLLGVDKTIIRRAAESGKITPIKDGRAVYYRREQVLRLAELRQNRLSK